MKENVVLRDFSIKMSEKPPAGGCVLCILDSFESLWTPKLHLHPPPTRCTPLKWRRSSRGWVGLPIVPRRATANISYDHGRRRILPVQGWADWFTWLITKFRLIICIATAAPLPQYMRKSAASFGTATVLMYGSSSSRVQYCSMFSFPISYFFQLSLLI